MGNPQLRRLSIKDRKQGRYINSYKMGFIYIITCTVNNKCYIGQTIRTVDIRVKEHFKAAYYKFNEGCLAINAAIRMYGTGSFKYETIFECDDKELDFWEQDCIEAYETLAPKGYNLVGGGNTNKFKSEETLDRLSKSRREYYKDDNLPRYVQRLKTKYGEGFIYYRTGYKRVQFCSNKLTIDQKKELAVEYSKNPIPNGGKRGKVTYEEIDGKVRVILPNR